MKRFSNIAVFALLMLFGAFDMYSQSVTVTFPNGGETLQIGTAKNILWTSNSVSYVDIEYSTDNGASWNTIITDVAASVGKYTWNIDSNSVNPSTQALIRISSSANASVYDVSNSVFTLSELHINFPFGGSIVQQNRAVNISWFVSSDIPSIRIDYSIDGGNTWNFLAGGIDPNNNVYLWDVNVLSSNTARLKISSEADPSLFYETDDFTVAQLDLLAPDGGEAWQTGTTHVITWQSENVVNVDLQYSVNGGAWKDIAAGVPAGGGSYSWTIPDELSDQVYVRILNSDEHNVYDRSASQFTILNLQIVSPNGGEGFEIGTQQAITWTTNLSGTITLELSTDGGNNYDTQLATGVNANLGSYTVTVGNVPTNQARVRILSDANASILDESEDDFTIGSLSIVAPVGGENWLAGTVHPLRWTNTPGIEVVSMDYSLDNGTTWNVIVSSYPSASGQYNWYVPNGISGDMIIRIYDAVTGIGKNHVSNPLTVATLQITSPLNGAIYNWGDNVVVNWTASSNITNVRIEYSTDYGSTFTLIENNVNAAAGTYNWTIPNGLSSDGMQIRLTAEDNQAFSSVSPGYFTVGNIQVLTPNGGETIVGGITYNITWSATSSVGNVRIEYSVDGGATYTNIPGASAVPASDGSYAWEVPNVATNNARIRISDSQTSNIIDASDNDFTIGILQLTNPNGGRGYFPGGNIAVQWNAQSVNSLLIEYTTDGGNTWNTIASGVNAAAGSYNWTIPNSYTSEAMVRISDLNNAANLDTSDTYFRIGNIGVTYPNGGEILQTGKTYNVTYDYSANIENINVEVSTDNGTTWNFVASNVAATGSFGWTVSDIPSANVLLRITDADYPELTDVSDNSFSVERLNLLAPNGGEFFLVDSIATISWNSSNVANIKIDYSTDNGAIWTTVIASTPANTQSYDWRIPNAFTTNALVRISDADNPSAFVEDTSDAVFTINLLYLEAPNGGEAYNVYDTTLIKWHSHSSVASIDLQYSTNNGTSWNPIASGITASDNEYRWQVPNTPTSQALVRIVNQANTNVLDVSNSAFSIGSITLVSPNGGEKWQVDSVKYIKWNNIVSVSNVNLLYSTDGGANWITIANSVRGSDEQYAWTIPNTVSGNALVRVESAADTTIADESNSVFSIANIVVTYPNGGEFLQAGKNLTITWNAYNINTLTLQYSTDNGTTWTNIESNYAASMGSYDFDLPDNISTNAFLIRLYDDDFPTVHDISDAASTVELLNLTSPNGGEGWNAGATKNITWNASNISNIDILFSQDGGTTWDTLASNVNSASGSYSWNIPSSISTETAIVKLRDAAHSAVSDSSAAAFKIGKLTITEPVAGESWQAGTVQTLKWTATASVTAVKIEFTSDGTNWQTLENNYNASAGSYSVLVPSVSTNSARFRISDVASGSEIAALSDIFTISSLQITSPTSTALWTAGDSHEIKWSSSNVANVKLEYSDDDGNTWQTIAASVSASLGSYTWDVPSSLASRKTRIKISDVSNPLSKDSTDAFTTGKISILSPEVTSVWQGGKTYKVKWAASSSIERVSVDYSLDNGANWINLSTNVIASDSFVSWIVPGNTNVNTAQVRVYHASSDFPNNNAIYGVSPSFAIVSLDLTTPNTATNWQARSTQNITWQAGSLLNNVSLDYSLDGGSTWKNIARGIDASAGSYAWTLPDTTTSAALVKISSDDYAGVVDSMTSPFNISDIEITNVSSATEWLAGARRDIRWNAHNLNRVDIQYTTDNGANWHDVISGISASRGSFTWSIPATAATDKAAIRITASDYPSVSVTSDLFTIKGLSVTSPNGGENWQVGNNETITWTSAFVNNIEISLSTDNGSTWIEITSGTAATNGSYSWTVPDSIATVQGLIRIVDTENSAIRDSSDANFTVGRLVLTSPVGGEEWQIGSRHNITWNSINVNNVRLEYSTDNGANWNEIIASVNASVSSYEWEIPSGSASATALVRITSLEDASVSYTSNLFTITELTVLAPNGGEVLQAGSAYTIRWSATNIDKIDLAYSLDNGAVWTDIVTNLNASVGSLNWTIPNNINSTTALVRAVNSDDPAQRDSSDNIFTINSFQVTYPIGTEHLQAGKTYNVTWAAGENISTVTLAYSLDGGATWTNMVSGIDASAGGYAWTIPDGTQSTQARVRVADDGSALVSSSGDFTIEVLDLTAPAGGEYWQAGTVRNITWNSGLVTNVKIEFSSNNGADWITLSNSESAAGGTYSWNIPADYSTQEGVIRISDVDNSGIYATNANPVVIGAVEVIAPNGGEILQSGENYTIKWTQSASIERVNIDYSIDNGANWISIASSSDSAGTYVWTVPENVFSDNSLVRVSDASSSGAIYDVSDATFKIGSLKLTSPNGGESLLSGTQANITWLAGTNINNIKIEFYTPVTGWALVANMVSANAGVYAWSVPANYSDSVKIRITSLDDNTITDESDAFFRIANVKITAPAVATKWQYGDTERISWANSANVQRVNLFYTTGNGIWQSIAANLTASQGSYLWSVPNISTDKLRIKIEDVNGVGSVYDTTAFNLTAASLEITQPNAQTVWLAGSTQNITWNASAYIRKVAIKYSIDKAATWLTVIDSTDASTGRYSWSVPTAINSDSILISIRDVDYSNVDDTSAYFKVSSAELTLISPNGGEYWQAGTDETIRWNATSNIGLINIYYSVNSGANWTELITNYPASNQSYVYSVPSNFASDNFRIKIVDASNAFLRDSSSHDVYVRWINLVSPIGGEHLQAGLTHNIQWTNSANVSTVRIDFSTDGGNAWNNIATIPAAGGSFAWTVNNLPTDSGYVRISDANSNLEIISASNAFTISMLQLVSPVNGGEVQGGDTVRISWLNSADIENVQFHYSLDRANWYAINTVPYPADSSHYDWILDNSICGDSLYIRISDFAFQTVSDTTPKPITVKQLSVENPAADEQWQVGTAKQIKWTACGINTVKLQYSISKGVNWIDIASGVNASAGVYNWTIPNTTGDSVLVKVTDESNSEISALSGYFEIYQPQVEILYPNGGEFLQAGKDAVIRWSSSLVNYLNFEYSLDGGATWTTIANTVAASQDTLVWTIPSGVNTTQCLIRATDAETPGISDASNNPFTIANLTLVQPVGNEYLQAGDTYTIKWTASAEIVNVKLSYTTNEGLTWSGIDGATSLNAAAGSFDWRIPNGLSSNVTQIRVQSVAHDSVQSVSNNFTTSWIAITQPVGGEVYIAGQNIRAVWNNGIATEQVLLELLNGKTGAVVASKIDSARGYAYVTIPSYVVSDSLKLRISDARSNYRIADTSASYFNSTTLKIVTPDGNTNWRSGSTQRIIWNSGAHLGNLAFEYSLDGGNVWFGLTESVAASADTLVWNVPENVNTNSAVVRCYDKANISLADTTESFTIYTSQLRLIYPNGGEKLQAGSSYEIKWESSFVTNLRIEFSSDNGATWDTLTTSAIAADSAWTWNVPAGISTNEALIKLTSLEDSTLIAQSASPFAIGWLRVLTPVLNDVWMSGQNKIITWQKAVSVKKVNLFYSLNGNSADSSLTLIASNVNAADTHYVWTIPPVSSNNALVVVTDAESDGNIKAQSQRFTIGKLQIVYPNGGEFIQSGSDLTLHWSVSADIIPFVHLEYTLNGGRSWTRIATSVTSSDTSYVWSIPSGVTSDSALVRIINTADNNIADTSDAFFSIGGLEMLVFNSYEKVLENTVKELRWSITQNIDNIDLLYRTSDNVWKPIVQNYPADSLHYYWTIPQEPSDSCYVMIRDSRNPLLNDITNEPFTIARLGLLNFNGGGVYQTGTQQEIYWQSSSINYINIEYSIDSVNWNRLSPNPLVADSGKFVWNIPDEMSIASKHYLLRLVDAEYNNIADTSNSEFTVSYIKMKSPNGGEGQQLGTSYTVEWATSTNTVEYVNLYLELTAGSDIWTPIANNIPAADLQYYWLIQSEPSPAARMKVEDAAHHSIYDISDSTFIIAKIKLLEPNGNEKLQVGGTKTIRWSSTYINNITIEYSANNGASWNFVASVAGDSGKYEWRVPNSPTNQARIRIKDFDYPNVFDLSDTTFSIVSLRVTEPNDYVAFNIGSPADIKWESSFLDSVRIQLSTDGGATFGIEIAVTDAAAGSYSWTVPNIPTAEAKIKITDIYAIDVSDVSDTTFLIGAYPTLTSLGDAQTRTIKMLYNLPNAGERVDLRDFEFRVNNGSYVDGKSYLIGDYNNLVGPSMDTLWWNSKGQLDNFEGYVGFRVRFRSEYGVSYTLTLDSIIVDNKAPQFNSTAFTVTQDNFLYGWNKAVVRWDSAADLSQPVRYELFVSETSVFDTIPNVDSYGTQAVLPGLKTSTVYYYKVKVTDKFDNYSEFSVHNKTNALADFNSDGRIDGADLAAYVFAWSDADSSAGADMYPYQGDIPIVEVQPDNSLDLSDLVVFQQMWNYYVEYRGLPKDAGFDAESREITFTKGDNSFTFPIEIPDKNISALSVSVKYDANVFTFDSLDFKPQKPDGNDIVLAYADSARGEIIIDYANLSGKIGDKFSLASVIDCNFDALKHADSLTVTYTAYDKRFEKAFEKSVVYTLHELPNTYKLYQNYPNPFNPVTTILYDVPVKSKVTLKVYDILGREVATLVNKVQKAGSYKATFSAHLNGKTLASGVYFYRIIAGKYVDTKKMVILK